MQSFAGRWQAPDRFYVEVLADGTVKGALPVTMSESKIKAEPGLSYQEGNWAVYGNRTCYSMTIEKNRLDYQTDEKTFCLKPDYTSMKLLEKHPEGNLYAKQLIGTATLNAEARVVANVLEVTVPISHLDGNASAGKAPASSTIAVLVRAIMHKGKLCLSAVDLAGFTEQCYERTAPPTSKQENAVRREDRAAAAPTPVLPSRLGRPSAPAVARQGQSSEAGRIVQPSISTDVRGSSVSAKAAPIPKVDTSEQVAMQRIDVKHKVQPAGHEAIKVSGSIQQSKLIKRVVPLYPELAKRARVQGMVILTATVD